MTSKIWEMKLCLLLIKEKSAFDWLAAKFWLKESTILWRVCTFEKMNLDEYHGLCVNHLLLAITLQLTSEK